MKTNRNISPQALRTAVIGAAAALMLPLSPAASAQDEYWHQRVTLFDRLPVTESDIVFLGNSITDGGEFSEIFGMENCLNRGIRSDVIDGVRKRLSQVTSGHPKKIFLLIGINDVSHGLSAGKIADQYEKLIDEIRTQTPTTTLYVQSVMPINNDFRRYRNLVGREEVIPELNERLREICARHGAVFVDLWPALADKDGKKLDRRFTNDGLHLTGAGYRAWADVIRDHVVNDEAIVTEEPEPESIHIKKRIEH